MYLASVCWIMPVTMSPSLPAYSSYLRSRSASRIRWVITWRAVWAAIRPKFSGVTSNSSPTGSPSSSRSWASTRISMVSGSMVTHENSWAPGMRL